MSKAVVESTGSRLPWGLCDHAYDTREMLRLYFKHNSTSSYACEMLNIRSREVAWPKEQISVLEASELARGVGKLSISLR